MSDAGFPKPVAKVVATLADIFRHQRRSEIVELLESAHAWFDNVEFDNWNGGTYAPPSIGSEHAVEGNVKVTRDISPSGTY